MCWRGHPTGLWGHIKVKLASRCCRPGGGDPGSGGGTRGGASCLRVGGLSSLYPMPACFPAPAEASPLKAIRVLSARLMQSPRWLSSPVTNRT